MKQPQYKYSPLKKGGREIRLAILQPAEGQASEIRIQLVHVSLGTLLGTVPTSEGTLFQWSEEDPPPHYTALSYCWGTDTLTQAVFINDIETAVTSNLESALRHLRLPGSEEDFGSTRFASINKTFWRSPSKFSSCVIFTRQHTK